MSRKTSRKIVDKKKNVLLVVVVLWVVLSMAYVIRDQWQEFKANYIQLAYQQGLFDSVNIIIDESEKCTPIPLLIDGETVVEIIAVSCFQLSESEEIIE